MRRLPLLLLVAVMMTACQAAGPSSAVRSFVAIPTAEPLTGMTGCMDALLMGRLAADDEAGIVVQPDEGPAILVVWPHGWAAVDEDGQRVLLNDRGDPIARVGDHVQIGGGEAQGRWHTCGEVTLLP